MELILILVFASLALAFSLVSLTLTVLLKIKYEVFMNSTQAVPLAPPLGSADIHSLADELFRSAGSEYGVPPAAPKIKQKDLEEPEDNFPAFNVKDLV